MKLLKTSSDGSIHHTGYYLIWWEIYHSAGGKFISQPVVTRDVGIEPSANFRTEALACVCNVICSCIFRICRRCGTRPVFYSLWIAVRSFTCEGWSATVTWNQVHSICSLAGL
jgi:hypothetical protein